MSHPSRPVRPRPPRSLAGIRARKSLGQHFLTDTKLLRRIADAAKLDTSSTVLEIGAGTGSLTAELSSRALHVFAIELDGALAAGLRSRFRGTNVTVVHDNALNVQPGGLVSQPYSVVGNLPYNVAQPLLRHFLEAAPKPERLVVMVQAEVAERIVARRGDMSLLAVSVQLYGEATLLFRVPPSCFYPPPKVQSAVVRIDVAPTLRANVPDVEAFFRIARACFSTRRKQLRNALANGLGINTSIAADMLSRAGIDPALRPQAIPLESWAVLTEAWVASGRPVGSS